MALALAGSIVAQPTICGAATDHSAAPAARVDGRVEWARAGEALVLPVEPTEEQRRAGAIPARLSRGDTVFAPLWWIGRVDAGPVGPQRVLPEPSAGAALLAARGAAWMGERGSWTAIAATDTIRRTAINTEGRWYVVIELPPDSAGLDLVLDGRPVRLGWIAKSVATSRPSRDVGAEGLGGWVSAALDAARRNPHERWRARLASGEPMSASGPAQDEFADSAVEALADQLGARWALAIRRVDDEDAAAADRLRRRLALVADFGGVRAPAWPVDDGSMSRLLDSLLAPAREGRGPATIAREWMDAQPRAACWIADDAVMFDAAAGRIVSRMGAVMLDAGSGSEVLMVQAGAGAAPADVVAMRPFVSAFGLFALDARNTEQSSVVANIGGWTARRAVVPRPVRAMPPGAAISPLFEDWTLADWLGSCTDPADPRNAGSPGGLGRAARGGRAAAAMLLAEAPTATGPIEAGGLRWTLYVECGVGPGTTADSERREEVNIALTGAGGEAMLRAFADGQLVWSDGSTARARVARDDRAWRMWIPLPASIIREGSWIRLGMSRIDSTGARASWPRPMFPWEDRPAQAVFDLSTWEGLGADGAGRR